jgi:hypothetical protein
MTLENELDRAIVRLERETLPELRKLGNSELLAETAQLLDWLWELRGLRHGSLRTKKEMIIDKIEPTKIEETENGLFRIWEYIDAADVAFVSAFANELNNKHITELNDEEVETLRKNNLNRIDRLRYEVIRAGFGCIQLKGEYYYPELQNSILESSLYIINNSNYRIVPEEFVQMIQRLYVRYEQQGAIIKLKGKDAYFWCEKEVQTIGSKVNIVQLENSYSKIKGRKFSFIKARRMQEGVQVNEWISSLSINILRGHIINNEMIELGNIINNYDKYRNKF